MRLLPSLNVNEKISIKNEEHYIHKFNQKTLESPTFSLMHRDISPSVLLSLSALAFCWDVLGTVKWFLMPYFSQKLIICVLSVILNFKTLDLPSHLVFHFNVTLLELCKGIRLAFQEVNSNFPSLQWNSYNTDIHI